MKPEQRTKLLTAWDIVSDVKPRPVLREDDLTVDKLCKESGLTYYQARKELAKRVNAGTLRKVPCYTPTGTVVAYRLPTDSV